MADLARKGIPGEAGHVFGEALILLVQWKGGAERSFHQSAFAPWMVQLSDTKPAPTY